MSLSFSAFFFISTSLDISLGNLSEKNKKKFERLSRVRPLLCDGRVEVSTTARTKTTTVVNRTCEFIRSKFFISSRTNGKKRRENTERRAERGAQKKTERVGRTHLTSPVYTQFRRFRRAKKEEDLASSFLVVFGFLPPEFLRHSLPAIFIDRDACVAKIFRSGERNKKKHQKRKKQNLSFLTSV